MYDVIDRVPVVVTTQCGRTCYVGTPAQPYSEQASGYGREAAVYAAPQSLLLPDHVTHVHQTMALALNASCSCYGNDNNTG